jgi:hypothetical protein
MIEESRGVVGCMEILPILIVREELLVESDFAGWNQVEIYLTRPPENDMSLK